MTRVRRVLIVGAGPVGLAAALGALRRGLDATVLERDTIGASLLRWGPTRFFSPLAMNVPREAIGLLGADAPSPDAILTGPEFVAKVLAPLAARAPLAGRVRCGHRVVTLGRAGLCRGDYARHPLRAERPFRALVETPEGERAFEADAVLDASGTYGQPRAMGVGGLPAPGERALGERIVWTLGDLDARRTSLAGRAIVLVGSGHSAANAVHVLEGVAREAPDTRVVWVTRAANLRPCTEVANDPLPERHRVVRHANALAARPPGWLRVERRAAVESVAASVAGAVRVALSGGRTVDADAVVSLTGYRPDASLVSELAVETDPWSEGAARLSRALANVTDCLSVPALSPADLDSGEPGFHFVGARSYGSASTFLLKTGYAQLETVLDGLCATA